MSYSETEKKIIFSKRYPYENYRVVGEDYQVDCPQAVMKVNVNPKGNLVSTLDIMGEVSIVEINEKKPWSRNQMCAEIVAIQNDFYSQKVIQTTHNLIASQVTQHEGESLHV